MEQHFIEVTPQDCKFIVHFVEGGETWVREFTFLQHAQSWADGQFIRMREKKPLSLQGSGVSTAGANLRE